jgi:hypothetical protein
MLNTVVPAIWYSGKIQTCDCHRAVRHWGEAGQHMKLEYRKPVGNWKYSVEYCNVA